MTDSRIDTYQHIAIVRTLLDEIVEQLLYRGRAHDATKLISPEVEMFDEYSPKLKQLEYGTDEYWAALNEMSKALVHHYQHNRHHPEHHPDGIRNMNLIDVVEMFCDWIAATKRVKDGDIHASIDKNQERFGYSDDLKAIFHNTVRAL